MCDKTSNKKGLTGHRTFDVTAESTFGFSDLDFNDSKAYFKLFEKFRKCYLNPAVVLKRLPRNHLYIGNTGHKMGGAVKRRCSSRVRRSLTGASQPKTRREENVGDDIECSVVRSLSSELGNSSVKSLPEEIEEAAEENLGLEVTAIKTNLRKLGATTVHRPTNHEVIHSSGSVELMVEHQSDNVDDRINNIPSTPEGSLFDERTSVFKTRTASDGRESSRRFGKSRTPKIDEYSENLYGSISSSRVSSEAILEQVTTSQKSTAYKAKLKRTQAEDVSQPMNHEVIHSSGFVELTVEHQAENVVDGINSRLSSFEGSLLERTNGFKTIRASTGLGSSNRFEKSRTHYSEKLDGVISSSRVAAEMIVERVATVPAQNSTACIAKLLRTTEETLSLPAYPEEGFPLRLKRSKTNSGRKSEGKRSLDDGTASGDVKVGFESVSRQSDDSSLKLRSCCDDVLCNCLSTCDGGSLRKIPNKPAVVAETLGQTKNDSEVHLKLTRNTSLPRDDDMIRTAKFIEHEKSKYELAGKLWSPPKLPPTSDGECETSRIIVGTNRCADFYIESQSPESANGPAGVPREEWIETRNICPVPSSPIFKTKKENPVRRPPSFLNREMVRTLKMWTILKPCVVKLERMHDLDNLVKKHSMNIFGMRMVYKYRHVKSTRAVSPKSASAGHFTPNAQFNENTAEDESVAVSSGNNECTNQIAQKKIDLSDGLALKKFCQLESVVIEDSDTDQEVEGQMEKASPPIQCDKQPSPIAILSALTVPAVRHGLGDTNSVESSLHESDLLQHEPFQIEKERLCDSIWSDVLDFGEPDASEIEDVSAFRDEFCDPLPFMNHSSIPPLNYGLSERPVEAGSITDTLVSESDQRSLDTEDLGPELNNLEERVKRFCRDVLNPSPDKSNTANGSIHYSLNSESPSAESKPPGCSKTPPKIRLKVARKRGKTAKDDVSYIYSYGENSEPVNLSEYESLPRRPFKRLKFTDKNVSNTIVDHDSKPSVKVDDSSTQLIKVEKSDHDDKVDGDSVGKVSDTRACKVSTNPCLELSTIPYILKCNFQNRCRKCKNLNPCANANKKFKLFFSLNVGAGRKLSQPLLDALRNREDPCEIDRTAAYIAASAVLPQPCTILVPAAPELIQILLPSHWSNMIMELLTETNQMENKVRKSIQASAFAEALEVKRAIIAMKTKSPLNLENDSIQPAIFHKILSELPFLPYRSNQSVATKSNIDNKIKFVRKCMLPIMPEDSKVVLYPSVEAAEARQFGEIIDVPVSESDVDPKEVSRPQEKCSEDHEGKDDLSLSDLSEMTSLTDIRSIVDELTPPLDSSMSRGIEVSCDVAQPSSPGNDFCRSSPLKRTVSSVEPDSRKVDESVEREPKNHILESSSGGTVNDGLSLEPGDHSILNCSSPGLSKECVDDTNKDDSVSRLGDVSLASDELLGSSSSALVNFNLSDMCEPTVDPVPNENTNEVLGESVLDDPSSTLFGNSNETAMMSLKDSKQQSISSGCSNILFTQTETGDLIIPFEMMPSEPTCIQEHGNVSSNNGSGDWLLTMPPVATIPPAVTIPSKVVGNVHLESQVPYANSLAQKDQNPHASQQTSDETPDVILVPDKFESIDLTACEEEKQSIREESTIDSTSIGRTPSLTKNTPISREPYPEWGVICSSLPELGYVKVRKVGSRLMIYDISVVSEPLGFQNIHELNRFLNSRLADLSYSYRKKIALEWIMVTSGYLKVKTIPPTNPQFWRHPSTAAETHRAMREFHKKLSISKIEASKRLKASQTKTSSPVIVSTCSVGEKARKRNDKPIPQKKSTAKPTAAKEQFSKDGKTVRINGQLVSMGTPVAYSKSLTNSNVDDMEVKDATAQSSRGGMIRSVTRSPVSAATVITSIATASNDALVNPAMKTIETCGSASEWTASTDESKTTKESYSSIPAQLSIVTIASVSTDGTMLLASSPNKVLETIALTPSPDVVSSSPTVTLASTQSVPLIHDGLPVKSIPVTTGSLGKSVPQGSVGSSGVSISCEEPSRLTLVGSRKTTIAPVLPANGKTYMSLLPVVRSSACSKTELPTASVSLAPPMVSMTINPTRQTSPSYRQIVVTPGSVDCIVLTSTVTAPNNALLASTSVEKRMANTITTSTKRTSVCTRPTPVATITSTKTGTAASFLVQSHNVPTPNTHQAKTRPPGVRSNHRPILILRKGALFQTPPPSKNAIRSLLRNK